ncbi:hypothetical protein H257_18931 [Aphanomyces astaci]|uniref:LamG-like jellyroll fold domain-containing protein n=1 Tax=Aphanomyces astaci TaxID=112090 RepID=W4FBR1_APHAT|nr:hypothetical protein H257_18931 [Aphanomyces astaci]ETV64133.1 hypothetical protein H257_18931 [Aphanomyces astaci]|eukprot:XP_009846380.1 hypothetical protein H257_18931 [Aphanomyces astaci]
MKRTASVFLSCDRLLLAVCVSTKSDWNSTLVSTGPVSANQWTHVAIVCDNVTLRLYIQGKEDRTLSLNDVVTTIRSVSSPPGVKKASTDYKGFRGYLQHMLLYPTTRAWMAKDVAKYVKERKPSVDSTDLSCARPPLSNPVTPSHMDSPDVVTYFSPSSDEFHMQVTVWMGGGSCSSPPRGRMQVLAACASPSGGVFAFVWGHLSIRTKDRHGTHLDAATSGLVDLYVGNVPYEVPLMAPWAGDIAETTHYTFSESQRNLAFDVSSTGPNNLHGRVLHDSGWRTEPPLVNQLAQPRTPPLQVDTDAPSISGRILAFMERMAVVYLRSSCCKILVGCPRTRVVVSSGAVWTHVLTFVLLHSLLRHAAFEKDVDTQGGQPIVALLRILRANFQPLSSVLSTDVAVPCLACPPRLSASACRLRWRSDCTRC